MSDTGSARPQSQISDNDFNKSSHSVVLSTKSGRSKRSLIDKDKFYEFKPVKPRFLKVPKSATKEYSDGGDRSPTNHV